MEEFHRPIQAGYCYQRIFTATEYLIFNQLIRQCVDWPR